MKKAYIIPHHNLTYGNNKTTMEKVIIRLYDDYLINQDVMEKDARLELLETIMNVTHIYLNMSLEEWTNEKQES